MGRVSISHLGFVSWKSKLLFIASSMISQNQSLRERPSGAIRANKSFASFIVSIAPKILKL
jgi:hypothetical protein